jgi:hypothetical protein
MEAFLLKSFPDNYSANVVKILHSMSMKGFKDLHLVGSAAIRSQIYSADYDAMENVKAKSVEEVVASLKKIIKEVRVIPECYFGDIKCGEVPQWNVFRPNANYDFSSNKIVDFNIKESQTKVDNLRKAKVITEEEAKIGLALLEKATAPFEFLEAKKLIRWHILRWKPSQILEGVQHYRGHTFTLEDAVQSGGMIKTDVIANIRDRFTEFSMIYSVFIKGKRVTPKDPPIINSLMEDILYYNKINPFKALKRSFALIKQNKNVKDAAVLVPILNSDLGRLYQIIADLKTLEDLLNRPEHPIKEIKLQIEEMKVRMGNIYQLKDFLRHEHDIMGSITSMLRMGEGHLKNRIAVLIDSLQKILNHGTLKFAKGVTKLLDKVKL